MCITVNDAFAADAWAQAHGAEGKVVMLADARVRGSGDGCWRPARRGAGGTAAAALAPAAHPSFPPLLPPQAELTKALGFELDAPAVLGNTRCRRCGLRAAVWGAAT